MRRSSKPLPRSLTSLGGPSLATPPGGSTPTKGSSRGDVSSRTSAVGRSVSRGRYGATPSSTVPNHGSSLTFTGSSSTVWGSRTTFTSAANHRVLAPTRASKAHLYNYDGQVGGDRLDLARGVGHLIDRWELLLLLWQQAENLRYLQRRDPKIHPSVKVPSVNDVTKRLTTADNSRHGDIEREHIRLHHMHDPRVRKSQSRSVLNLDIILLPYKSEIIKRDLAVAS